MSTYAFAVPILEGKTETWKRYVDEMKGARRDEWQRSRQKLGLRTEQVWLQETPMGDMCVVRFEVDSDPRNVFEGMSKSEDSFDKWFRDKILVECHGMDFSQQPQINKFMLDLQTVKEAEKAYSGKRS